MASIAAFTALELLAVAINERFGLGSGLSFFMAASWVGWGGTVAWELDPTFRTQVVAHVAPAMAIVIIATVALLRSSGGRVDEGRTAAIGVAPVPSGLAPLNISATIITLATMSGSPGLLLVGPSVFADPRQEAAVSFVLIIVATVALAAIFHPVERVARLAVRAAKGNASGEEFEATMQDARHRARSGLRVATGRALLFLAGLRALPFLAVADLHGPVAKLVVSFMIAERWAVLAAVALDLATEWKARARHEDWTVVAVQHRVYAARLLVSALEQRGIGVFARGLDARTCFHFFGPYIPIELFVRQDDAAKATAIVEEILAPAPTEAPQPAAEATA
jgi:hypothetical protein